MEVKSVDSFYKSNSKCRKDGLSCYCKSCTKAECADRYSRNLERGIKRNQVLTESQRKRKRATSREWAKKNSEKVKEANARYLSGNAERVREMARIRSAERYARIRSNPDKYRNKILEISMRGRFSRFANRGKSSKMSEVIDYSFSELCVHIERQFEDGMSWKNRSKWHIDHIRPLSSFADPCDPSAWCLSNLRPVWASENLKKNSKALFLL